MKYKESFIEGFGNQQVHIKLHSSPRAFVGQITGKAEGGKAFNFLRLDPNLQNPKPIRIELEDIESIVEYSKDISKRLSLLRSAEDSFKLQFATALVNGQKDLVSVLHSNIALLESQIRDLERIQRNQ